jgi:triosephosphate isomerase
MQKITRDNPIVAANWKMNPARLREARKLFSDIKRTAAQLSDVQTVVCAPNLYLGALTSDYSGRQILLGAEDISAHPRTGSYTGEVSGEMLADSGADVTVVGHSERRAAGETDKQVAEKTKRALDANLTPIVCFGEKDRDEAGDYLEVLERQLAVIFRTVSTRFHEEIILAYEPVWAIGGDSKQAVTPHILQQTAGVIRKTLAQNTSQKVAGRVPVLYGGSVKRDNCRRLYDGTGIDGFLIGGASLDAKHFSDILKRMNEGVNA